MNWIIGIVRAKELLVALEEGVDVAAIAASPAIIVPEPSIRQLLGVVSFRGSVYRPTSLVWHKVYAAGCASHCGGIPDADETLKRLLFTAFGW